MAAQQQGEECYRGVSEASCWSVNNEHAKNQSLHTWITLKPQTLTTLTNTHKNQVFRFWLTHYIIKPDITPGSTL